MRTRDDARAPVDRYDSCDVQRHYNSRKSWPDHDPHLPHRSELPLPARWVVRIYIRHPAYRIAAESCRGTAPANLIVTRQLVSPL